MFRKALFWGLTLMLLAIIVSLAIRSRRNERKQAPEATEIVRESKPTPTRVVEPHDLVITESKMKLVGGEAKGQRTATGHHEIVVRNDGPLGYENLQLKITYLGRGDKVLESRSYAVAKPVPPRQTESLGKIVIEDVPPGATNCSTRILFADLAR